MPEQNIVSSIETETSSAPTATVAPVLNNRRKKIMISSIIAGILVIFLAAAVLFTRSNANQGTGNTTTSSVSTTSESSSSESATSISTSTAPEVVKADEYVNIGNGIYQYTSYQQKFTFKVLNPQVHNIGALREGDKIWVHVSLDTPQQGQSVEIFEKDENQTLKQAIEERLLVGYDPAKCFVEINSTEGNIQRAGISFPQNQNPNEPWWANAANCPEGYSNTNGVRFFYHDSAHPDQFAFFDIGQYAINGSSDTDSWFDTFVFTD